MGTDKHREFGIAVTALVVGAMLAAGTILYGQNISAALVSDSDDRFIAYRDAVADRYQFHRRHIHEYDEMVRPQAELDTPRYTRAYYNVPEVEEVPMPFKYPGVTECQYRVRIASELKEIIVPLIPGNPTDLLERQEVSKMFDAYIAVCDNPPELDPEPSVSLPNDEDVCDNLLTVSQRRSCRIQIRQQQGRR